MVPVGAVYAAESWRIRLTTVWCLGRWRLRVGDHGVFLIGIFFVDYLVDDWIWPWPELLLIVQASLRSIRVQARAIIALFNVVPLLVHRRQSFHHDLVVLLFRLPCSGSRLVVL